MALANHVLPYASEETKFACALTFDYLCSEEGIKELDSILSNDIKFTKNGDGHGVAKWLITEVGPRYRLANLLLEEETNRQIQIHKRKMEGEQGAALPPAELKRKKAVKKKPGTQESPVSLDVLKNQLVIKKTCEPEDTIFICAMWAMTSKGGASHLVPDFEWGTHVPKLMVLFDYHELSLQEDSEEWVELECIAQILNIGCLLFGSSRNKTRLCRLASRLVDPPGVKACPGGEAKPSTRRRTLIWEYLASQDAEFRQSNGTDAARKSNAMAARRKRRQGAQQSFLRAAADFALSAPPQRKKQATKNNQTLNNGSQFGEAGANLPLKPLLESRLSLSGVDQTPDGPSPPKTTHPECTPTLASSKHRAETSSHEMPDVPFLERELSEFLSRRCTVPMRPASEVPSSELDDGQILIPN
jgi:hypothetical protein